MKQLRPQYLFILDLVIFKFEVSLNQLNNPIDIGIAC
jgi:hypothetical protein